jgi:hypothetical protein
VITAFQCRKRLVAEVTVLLLTSVCGLRAQASGADPRQEARTDEQSCISVLRTINVAQGTYWGGDEGKGFASSLRQLGPAGDYLIDADIASGKKDDYRFRLIPEHNHPIKHYTISARPIKRLVKDQRSFFTDETDVIRFTTENRAATGSDPPIDPRESR